eukprot:COSAG02_NODE_26688_length_627_cov_0.859848_1_plen_96_part_10
MYERPRSRRHCSYIVICTVNIGAIRMKKGVHPRPRTQIPSEAISVRAHSSGPEYATPRSLAVMNLDMTLSGPTDSVTAQSARCGVATLKNGDRARE